MISRGPIRGLLALFVREVVVAWTREVATEELRRQVIETGLCVEPRFGVSSPLAAQSPLQPLC